MPTPEALSLVHLIRHAVDMSDEDCALEADRFAAQRGAEAAPEPRCRMEQFGDGSCDCPQCRRMRGSPPQTGGGNAGEWARAIQYGEPAETPLRKRIGDLMMDGSLPEWAAEQLDELAQDQEATSYREGAETITDDMNAAHWHGYREGAEAMRERAANLAEHYSNGQFTDKDTWAEGFRFAKRMISQNLRALPIPGKTDAG